MKYYFRGCVSVLFRDDAETTFNMSDSSSPYLSLLTLDGLFDTYVIFLLFLYKMSVYFTFFFLHHIFDYEEHYLITYVHRSSSQKYGWIEGL